MRPVNVLIVLLALLASPLSHAVEPAQVSWATATRGGGFQLFGKNLAEVINATDSRLLVDAIATRGSRQNLELLEAGEVDVGQVEGNAARIALETGCPVIPLAHWGAQRLLPPYGRVARFFPPTKVVVRAGPPVDLSDLSDARSAKALRTATDRIMAAITGHLEIQAEVKMGVELATRQHFRRRIAASGFRQHVGRRDAQDVADPHEAEPLVQEDHVERLVPRDPFPLAAAAVADPLHRVQHPLGVVDLVEGGRALGAVAAARAGVERVALELADPPALAVTFGMIERNLVVTDNLVVKVGDVEMSIGANSDVDRTKPRVLAGHEVG